MERKVHSGVKRGDQEADRRINPTATAGSVETTGVDVKRKQRWKRCVKEKKPVCFKNPFLSTHTHMSHTASITEASMFCLLHLACAKREAASLPSPHLLFFCCNLFTAVTHSALLISPACVKASVRYSGLVTFSAA